MRRVQQPMLHVPSSISCDYIIWVFCVCYDTCARVKVRACLCAGTPHFSFLIFFALLAAAYSYGHRYFTCVDHCMFGDDVCMRFVCALWTFSHGTPAIAPQVCVDHFYVCVDLTYIYMRMSDVRYNT